MEWIMNIVDTILLHINKTVHKTTCANECCNNRCECKNEGGSSGEEVSVPTQSQEPEPKRIFTTKLEVRRLSQSSITPPPPPSLAGKTVSSTD